MGFNIAGIVINKNYENKIEELSRSLKIDFSFESEISYQEASEDWKKDGICDIYFAENGTLLFLPFNKGAINSYSIANQNVLTFAYSETSMAFNFCYYENGLLRRSISEINGNRFINRGKPLEEEAIHNEVSELIFDKIGTLLGQKFWDIDFESKAFRYNM